MQTYYCVLTCNDHAVHSRIVTFSSIVGRTDEHNVLLAYEYCPLMCHSNIGTTMIGVRVLHTGREETAHEGHG